MNSLLEKLKAVMVKVKEAFANRLTVLKILGALSVTDFSFVLLAGLLVGMDSLLLNALMTVAVALPRNILASLVVKKVLSLD